MRLYVKVLNGTLSGKVVAEYFKVGPILILMFYLYGFI